MIVSGIDCRPWSTPMPSSFSIGGKTVDRWPPRQLARPLRQPSPSVAATGRKSLRTKDLGLDPRRPSGLPECTVAKQRQHHPLPARRPAIVNESRTDAVEIEERPHFRAARTALYAVIAFLVSIVALAALCEVDRVVVATGTLVTSTPNLFVQPPRYRSSEHRRCSRARCGSGRRMLLATLDATFTQADVDQLRTPHAEVWPQQLLASVLSKPRVSANAPPKEMTPDESLQLTLHGQPHSLVRCGDPRLLTNRSRASRRPWQRT